MNKLSNKNISKINKEIIELYKFLKKSNLNSEAERVIDLIKISSEKKIKVSPIEAAVALGLLPASILLENDEGLDDKDHSEELEEDKSLLDKIFEEISKGGVEKNASKKKGKKKGKKKDRTPTKPQLWENAKAWAKRKYDVWPSAYAVGAALKRYKEKGGGWRGPKPVK